MHSAIRACHVRRSPDLSAPALCGAGFWHTYRMGTLHWAVLRAGAGAPDHEWKPIVDEAVAASAAPAPASAPAPAPATAPAPAPAAGAAAASTAAPATAAAPAPAPAPAPASGAAAPAPAPAPVKPIDRPYALAWLCFAALC